MTDDKGHQPGHEWLEIIKRPTQDAFASAFTKNVTLEASILSAPLVGALAIRAFFDATRAMYDQIAFVHETCSETRIQLEWKGRFEGRDVAGTTILSLDAVGAIESIRLYHRPHEQVIAFAGEFARRLRVSAPEGKTITSMACKMEISQCPTMPLATKQSS
jgi:hypothetical protein